MVIEPIFENRFHPHSYGFQMARYADDMVVLCRSREEAGKALETIREWMAGAGLTLHPEKTCVVDMNPAGSHFDFLGYRFKRTKRGRMMKLVRPKSLRKLRESIKPRIKRTSGHSRRQIRLSGSEGGAAQINAPFLPLSWAGLVVHLWCEIAQIG